MRNFLLDGFLSIGRGMASMFGGSDLLDDPEIRRIMETSAEEAMANDWNTVMGDYTKVFERIEKPNIKG